MPLTAARSLPLTGYLLLFAGMSLVGVYVALSKPLTTVFPVFLLAWLRFGLAAVVMLPWTLPLTGLKPHGRVLFLQSFFGNFLFSISMLTGVMLTSASATGVILSTLPAVVGVFSWMFLREHLGPRAWLAVGLAVAGVLVLTLARTGSQGGGSVVGNLLVFACVCCESIYVILGKRLTASLSPMRISALINLIGLLLMTPLGLWQASRFDFGQVSAGQWALLAFYSLSASIASTWLWLSGLKHVPAGHSGVFTIAMPLAACAVAIGWLGERLSPAHWLAFGLAIAGIALIAWPQRAPGRADR
ncbi:MAG TPA: DMT family transporter [Burkholderiaceae bacterium]|jgi:drug/metabolite transporter (DMT)-like permease|nr:DMT family transporter [Burkholderiaceae bacterium]